MSSVGQVKPHESITRFQAGEENSHIGLGSGMGLNVGEFCTVEFTQTLNGQIFHLIHHLATAVITGCRISFSIFICKARAESLKHAFGYEVFGGDQFDAVQLPVFLLLNEIQYLQVLFHIDSNICFE